MRVALCVRARASPKVEQENICAVQYSHLHKFAAMHQWAAAQAHPEVACVEERRASANDVRRSGAPGTQRLVNPDGEESLTRFRSGKSSMKIIVESNRDQRVLDWLVAQVGEEAVANACNGLAGSQRPYPSNIAKLLRLSPPANLALSSREEAQQHLASIRRLLGIGSNRGEGDGAA